VSSAYTPARVDEKGRSTFIADFSGEIASAATDLASIGRIFYEKNWVLGTSGNFSTVIARDPLVFLITASGAHKGELTSKDFLCLGADTSVISGSGKPSAETLIHKAIIDQRGAGAVLHTHSKWATVLSEVHAPSGGFAIEGYEMLKGLSGVQTHRHHEWLPILANTQDYAGLQDEVTRLLRDRPDIHGILLQGHGLYTWGTQLQEARRHVEILEFLLEVTGTRLTMKTAHSGTI